MTIPDQLSRDLKDAMKSKDQLRVDVIRMIKAAIQTKELEVNRQLDDAELSRVMTTLIKQRKEAAEQYQKGNRQDLEMPTGRFMKTAVSGQPVVNSQDSRMAVGALSRGHSTNPTLTK